jgi:hypothetical protein
MVQAAAAGWLSLSHSQGSNSTSRLCGVPAMRANTSASQASGSTSLSLAVPIIVAMATARAAPRAKANATVAEEASKPVPALQHIVDGSGDGGRARQTRRFLAQPRSSTSCRLCSCRTRNRSSMLSPLMERSMSNVKQRIDALYRLQRYG